MITCERCHTDNLDGAQYCDECGAALAGAPGEGPRATAEEDPPAPVADVDDEDALDGETHDAPGSAAGARSQLVVPAARTSVAGLGPSAGLGVAGPPARRTGRAHAKLVIDRGLSAGKEFPIEGDESHIGRWDADGGIFPDVDLDSDDPEAKVSRRHARITRRGGNYFIEDLGSTNGTFVNRGRRLLPGDRMPLGDGDEVIVGKTFLRFHVLS
ncbi:MAG TPA: FHA domain-containing protein [Pyrinomonadaceae bacterium]|nr:FHA domain-containing protein [Pyrinomonadaceae bacterium]